MSQIEGNPFDWMKAVVPGRSFIDIGGIGVGSVNEKVSQAIELGAASVAIADIQPFGHQEWLTFDEKMKQAEVTGFDRYDQIDIRYESSLAKLGKYDVVHSTGIFYHLPSPADALWALRRVVGEYLITNTVIFPKHVENEFGSVSLPDAGVLFLPAVTEKDRKVLDTYYARKFPGMDFSGNSPRPDDRTSWCQYVLNGELCCWPNWFYYSENAFLTLLKLCRFEVLNTFNWEDHAFVAICKPVD